MSMLLGVAGTGQDDDGWGSAALDLDAYLARIGYTGDRKPTAATLRALQHAHVTTIPWENVDMFLGLPTRLDIPGLQQKLVTRSRGGACSEHTTLFAAALEKLGYPVTALQGRVRMGARKRRPATHNLLRVVADDRIWISDVGFGSSPLEPLELQEGNESTQGAWHYRLTREADLWILHSHRDNTWIAVHAFTEQTRYPVDLVVTNHYNATHPNSPFNTRLLAQHVTDNRLVMLDNTKLMTVTPPADRTDRTLEPDEVAQVLDTTFGIKLNKDEAAKATKKLTLPAT
ncbi:arylamine N-acetyltransferase family protein [Umezawaea tangerina]|uniref:N-hydroxyarylamine O-acetyltransferase n=1 Tax=Umezawaea tangerina TaxID=84725 RepID=A0A2T0SP31_9PSEU|nr:arylamine N-acetyltransferase [Umezawaea tangerina]PRY35174.1 N-hydroxyarylamine O-acetyltransferase [Umezawaea tangerina]